MRATDPLPEVGRYLSSGTGRLAANLWPILQTSVAASLSYFLAAVVLGNAQPFFAPIATVVTIGLAPGQRGRRAVEVAIGVALGLAIADVIARIIGVGAVQLGVVAALAMVAAVFFGGRSLLVNQAAISAILVIALLPPDSGFTPDRFFNALVGGGVALAVSYLFPMNPVRLVEKAAEPIFRKLVAVLEEIAEALEEEDLDHSEAALKKARKLDHRVRDFDEALSDGYEISRLSPTRRRSIKHLELYAGASIRIELAVINTRVLARGAANAIRRGAPVPSSMPEAILDLSRAVRALADYLEDREGRRRRSGSRWRRRGVRRRLSKAVTTSPSASSWARSARRPWTCSVAPA
ncbi:FUSC family protein [Rubrobacter aplysinae]|uniref:FUSC family protein n=1 Tax=Rubrobacter aplysinae TaxID=909625 RepID=UPI00069D667C|nr:FUSC family protein [Rubrobacter aplysinae]